MGKPGYTSNSYTGLCSITISVSIGFGFIPSSHTPLFQQCCAPKMGSFPPISLKIQRCLVRKGEFTSFNKLTGKFPTLLTSVVAWTAAQHCWDLVVKGGRERGSFIFAFWSHQNIRKVPLSRVSQVILLLIVEICQASYVRICLYFLTHKLKLQMNAENVPNSQEVLELLGEYDRLRNWMLF